MGGRGSSSGKAMPAAEQDAVEYLASGDGMWINNMLRGRHGLMESDMTAEDRKLVKDLDSALNKAVGEQTLYRSVDASAIFGDSVDMYDLVQEITHKTYSGQKGKYAQTTPFGYVFITNGVSIFQNLRGENKGKRKTGLIKDSFLWKDKSKSVQNRISPIIK